MKDSSRLISWSYDLEGGKWLVASLEKTWVKLMYSNGRETLGIALSVMMVSSVAVVSLATTREFGRNLLQSPYRILLIR